MNAPLEPPRGSVDLDEYAWGIVARFDGYIQATTARVAIIAAFNSFFVGSIVLKFADIVGLYAHTATQRGAAILLLWAAIGALVSLGCGFMAIDPYLRSPRTKGDYDSLLFFAHVAEYESADAYLSALKNQTVEKRNVDAAKQAYALAQGLASKFTWIRRAVKSILFGPVAASALAAVVLALEHLIFSKGTSP